MFKKRFLSLSLLVLLTVPSLWAAPTHHKRDRKEHSMTSLTAHELTLVDENGRPKIRLSAASGTPVLQMLRENGDVALAVTVDITGHPTITLNNPEGGSTASLAVDTKGAHVKFDRPGGASSYLFLNDEGVGGIVLLDNTGKRRYEVLVNVDGSVTTGRLDDSGKLIP